MVGELYCRLSIESSLLVVGLDKYGFLYFDLDTLGKGRCQIWYLRWYDERRYERHHRAHCTALHCTALHCCTVRSTKHGARGTGHGVRYTQSRSASILFFIDHLLSLYDRCFFESLFHQSSVIWSPGPSNSIFPRRILSDLKILPLEPSMNLSTNVVSWERESLHPWNSNRDSDGFVVENTSDWYILIHRSQLSLSLSLFPSL